MEFNKFKRSMIIEAESATTLFQKLQVFETGLDTGNPWSDGKKHYVIVSLSRPLSPREKQSLKALDE